MLADIYTSTVNSGTPSSPFSYNSTNYPSVGPGTFDLNGGVPSRGKYVDNAPEGAYI